MNAFDTARWGEETPARDSTRRAIGEAGIRSEAECVEALLAGTALDAGEEAETRALTLRLATLLRERGTRGPVEALMREYALSSAEGIALMCLAEALLRTPDAATRDALIRDRVAAGDWRSHVGRSPSLFVNAASWGLLVTGRLHATAQEDGLARALGGVLARGGQPVVRRALDVAMRLMGEQFVLGETIGEALRRARKLERRGFRYSYDMLGEGAVTAADAARYLEDYSRAIAAIGEAARGDTVAQRPGISIKLSALHPRFERDQRRRVVAELGPKLAELARLAAGLRIGLNIDAEEALRLELSLDLFEGLCRDGTIPQEAGIGFVVQAYGKRAPAVIDHLVALGRETGRRLMVRLVKGAYWDSEIKRAQELGLDGFPVFTRRDHTDLCYLACARRMLAAPDAIYPQFATHNARTLATIHTIARDGDYEFQCLHGMGEALYEEVVGDDKLGRHCRIYAPVGTHETLLAYLVRRLLENGANTSFVNRIADPAVPLDDLAADPRARVLAGAERGAGHAMIRPPRRLFPDGRANARGFDLGAEATRRAIVAALNAPVDGARGRAELRDPAARTAADGMRAIRNPADPADIIGFVADDDPASLDAHVAAARAAAEGWATSGGAARGACLLRAADLFEERMLELLAPLAREAGKTVPNAISEVREAIDFLRYYGAEAGRLDPARDAPLGTVCAISPWNFPVAIFVGQVACALAAGNAVVAKPAEETPLLAERAVGILHEAGVPSDALRLVQGDGAVGAALVGHDGIDGVMFTGSTAAARAIGQALATRAAARGAPVPLVAETGGQNAMIVDSSALAEQVVADVLGSAFDSAGQRCSALRVLCLQEEIADRTITMIAGALDELALGDPRLLSTDIGPVIGEAQRDALEAHVAAMRAAGMATRRGAATPASGWFVAPAIIEIDRLDRLRDEVFGPVLHVLRWRRDALPALLAAIEATGYGLTFGVHTRLDETVARAVAGTTAGNVYVNRNMVGAVVGVQPFGGGGLSGTGPKAGGPLALRRMLARAAPLDAALIGHPPARATEFARAATAAGDDADGALRAIVDASPHGVRRELAGPVGESNVYRLESRGAVLCVAASAAAALAQIACVLAAGGEPVVRTGFPCPPWARGFVRESADPDRETLAAALFEGDDAALGALAASLAGRDGALVPLHARSGTDLARGAAWPTEFLMRERVVSTNTAAAGGNASLMSIG